MGLLNWLRDRSSYRGVYSGGNGDSAESAIVINLTSSLDGIMAEYAYVQQQCGKKDVDWTLTSQRLYSRGGKMYDVLTVRLKSGEIQTFWFDITEFFGKY